MNDNNGNLKRNLKNRHIQMIALGGAIGTGLFYGSKETISSAGPSVVLVYLLCGFVIYLILRAMGEMAVDRPVSGSFSQYAYDNLGEYAGFLSGWSYWSTYIFVSMAELSAIGSYMKFWFPTFPAWATALVFMLLITSINLVNVKLYGEFEFWFAIIKVVTIILFIVMGVVFIVFGLGAKQGLDVGVHNLWSHGGFAPNGIQGIMLCIVGVLFSFGGSELIGITAGEAEEPEKSIPKAISKVVYRILTYYILAILVILMIFPWDQVGAKSGFDGSPFVQIFRYVHISYAAGIINFVVIAAAASVYNSSLFSNSRMLHGLAVQGNAPKIFLSTGKSGTPVASILLSSGVTLVVVIISYLSPEKVFGYMMNITTISIVINWFMILITQIAFRKKRTHEQLKNLKYKMPFYPLSNYFVLAFLTVCIVIMFTSKGYRLAVLVAPAWLLALSIFYGIKYKLKKKV